MRDQLNAMDGASYFKHFAELLKTNPPTAEDAPMVAKLAKLGIVPGQDFDASKLDPSTAPGSRRLPSLRRIKSRRGSKKASLRETQNSKMAGCLPPKLDSTGLIIFSARRLPGTAWARIGLKTPCIPRRKVRKSWKNIMARTSTFCISLRVRCRPWTVLVGDDVQRAVFLRG